MAGGTGTVRLDAAPAHVRGDYPEWLDPYFAAAFGEERAAECAALASRAPVDLRVNTLKGDRDAAAAALAHLQAVETPWSPVGLRIALHADAKAPPASMPSPPISTAWSRFRTRVPSSRRSFRARGPARP